MAFVLSLWRRNLVGLLLWVVAFAIILVIFARNPDARSVVPMYRYGSQKFMDELPIYNLETLHGYLYFPAFGALFSPFYVIGPLLGDGLWRITGFAILTYAALRQARALDPDNWMFLVSVGLALALTLSLGAIRNGQSTILLTGACWLATMSATERKPWQTLVWATVALIAKPLAIIVLLLLGAIRLRLIPVLLLSGIIVLVLPYGFAPATYVNELNQSFAMLLADMAVVRPVHFSPADFTAPLSALDVALSGGIATAIRFVFAIATLGAVVWLDRNGRSRLTGLAIFIVAALYLSLFNPRTEVNSYAFIAAPLGLAIAYMMLHTHRNRLALVLGGLLFSAGLTGISPHLFHNFHLWLNSVVCVVISVGLVWGLRDVLPRDERHNADRFSGRAGLTNNA